MEFNARPSWETPGASPTRGACAGHHSATLRANTDALKVLLICGPGPGDSGWLLHLTNPYLVCFPQESTFEGASVFLNVYHYTDLTQKLVVLVYGPIHKLLRKIPMPRHHPNLCFFTQYVENNILSL